MSPSQRLTVTFGRSAERAFIMPNRSSPVNRFVFAGMHGHDHHDRLEQARGPLEDVEVSVRRRIEGTGQHYPEHGPRIGPRPRGIKGRSCFSLTTPRAGYTMETMAGAKRLLAALGTAALISCASGPEAPEPFVPPPDDVATATGSRTVADIGTAPGDGDAAEFVVSEEVYQRTFEEIEAVIAGAERHHPRAATSRRGKSA